MGESTEKKAMSDYDKAIIAKYLKAAIGAGALAAGTGAVLSRIKAKKDMSDLTDIEKARNVIVIPVKKDSFMDGLPTPDEFEKAYARSSTAQTGGNDSAADASPDDIEARKKAILSGRKVDFFGKSASPKGSSGKAVKSENSSGKKGVESAVRDEGGRFASHADPVAASREEKTAEGLLDMASHPSRTGDAMLRAGLVRPLAFTAGGLASVYLAAKLVEAVNRFRKERSDEMVDEAREEYVKLLEGGEKSAQAVGDNFVYHTLTTLGGSFMLPAALSAIIVNKIMEKRKADKKKKSMQSDSYPEEPLILYKTSEDKEVEISFETALASMLVKRAMFLNSERIDRSGIEKDAFLGFNGASQDEIVNGAIDAMGMPANSGNLLDLTKAYVSGDDEKVNSSIEAIKSTASKNMSAWDNFKKLWRTPSNAYDSPAFKDRLMSSGKFQDMLIGKFQNDDAFKSYGNQLVDDYIGRTFKKDGWLFNIISSLAKNTGLGNSMIEDRIRNMFPAAQNEQAPKA